MKKLIILRGLPASGKSTWIKERDWEKYVLCADTLRLMFREPNPTITQEYNSTVWKMLFNILEERMGNGSFTIVDATHPTWKSIKPYLELCEKNQYLMEIVDFSKVPLEDCLKRNSERENYKFVPEDIIKDMHQKMCSSNKNFEIFKNKEYILDGRNKSQ